MEQVNTSEKSNWIRNFYNWTMAQCEKPQADVFIGVFSFFESIIIPLPTDPLLLARATAVPKKALSISLLVVITSVLGGIAGYGIGWALWDVISPYIFKFIVSEEVFSQVRDRFDSNVFLFTLLGGFTPLPFKAFALSAGSLKLSFLPFLLGCLIGRGVRFFTIGALVYYFGESIRSFVEQRLEKIFIVLGVLVVLLVAVKYILFP